MAVGVAGRAPGREAVRVRGVRRALRVPALAGAARAVAPPPARAARAPLRLRPLREGGRLLLYFASDFRSASV